MSKFYFCQNLKIVDLEAQHFSQPEKNDLDKPSNIKDVNK
jgi:hypothetical protein